MAHYKETYDLGDRVTVYFGANSGTVTGWKSGEDKYCVKLDNGAGETWLSPIFMEPMAPAFRKDRVYNIDSGLGGEFSIKFLRYQHGTFFFRILSKGFEREISYTVNDIGEVRILPEPKSKKLAAFYGLTD